MLSVNANTKSFILSKNCLYNSLNFISDWNYLFKPGPYPDTEEKRLAAAKKYGLLPEEYKPYPDDGKSVTHLIS